MQFKQHAAWLFILALGMLAAAPYYRGRLPSRNVLMPAEAPLNTPALGVETVLIPPRVALAVIPAADSPNSLIAPNKPAIVVAIPDGAKLASNPPPFDVPPPHLPPMMPVFARRRDFTPSQPLIVEPLREQLSQPEPARERVHRVVDGLVKMRDASVKIGWDDFEKVTFEPAPNT